MSETKEKSRHPLLIFGTMAGVVLLLLVILVAVILWPPSPETVVSEMLVAVRQQDAAKMMELSAGPARSDLEAVFDGDVGGLWHQFWLNGDTLFQDFQITEAEVEAEEARVMVYYGRGLFQEQVFILRKEEKKWRVYDLEQLRRE